MPETLTKFIINSLAPDSHKFGSEPEICVSPAEKRVPGFVIGNEPDTWVLSTLTSCKVIIFAHDAGTVPVNESISESMNHSASESSSASSAVD